MSNPQTLNSAPTIRPYQRIDIDFLKQQPCMACFNQQRTGKTPTAIKVMTEQNLTKILVVCPASAIYPWATEFTRWSGYPAIAVSGTLKQKQKLVSNWKEGALIVSYGSVKHTERTEGLINMIIEQNPEGLILDEAHRIKERKTANAEAAFTLARHIHHRLALTGTPAPNKPHEIWSILHFLYPHQFKSYWSFIETYFDTYLVRTTDRTFKDIGGIKKEKVAELQAILNKCSTQRKRVDVMSWLPQKDYQKILLPPTKEQTKYLDELSNYFETEDVIVQGVLDRLIRYRQICLHPGLIDLKGKSPKLEWIQDYLKDYPDRPTIIFSKFTSFLKILDKTIEKVPHGMIIGETPSKKRAELVQDFQNGKFNLLILNIDAGKEALTLDRAEVAIFTDKYPPVGDIEQAEDRFISTTKDKAHKPHIIYELIMAGTYDEQLYTLIEKRAASVDAINNFKSYMKGVKI